jgi:L-ribulose-5-phosphate 3-epimerase
MPADRSIQDQTAVPTGREPMNPRQITRRRALAAIGGGILASPAFRAFAADGGRKFKIGACDWSIQKRGDPAALKTAKEIGLDGVEVSFGQPGEKFDLRLAENREKYLAEAKSHGVEIASLAIGILNQVPYASDAGAEQWVADCIGVMPKLNQKVVLLAFFGNGDIKDRPELRKEVSRRLKRVAPKAEAAGVILGIESYLNADEHLQILDAVGSPSVQVYFDVANMHEMGYDVCREIRQLGRDRICQIHCKENGFLLGEGKVDFAKVKQAVDEIGWQGWLIIEGAVPGGKPMFECYVKNQEFLRRMFCTT